MVESRVYDESQEPYMYPEEGYDAYLQDADILDRPDLFYPGMYSASFVSLGLLPRKSKEIMYRRPYTLYLFTSKYSRKKKHSTCPSADSAEKAKFWIN